MRDGGELFVSNALVFACAHYMLETNSRNQEKIGRRSSFRVCVDGFKGVYKKSDEV